MMPKINTALLVIVLSSLIWVFAERKVIKSTDTTVKLELAQPRDDLFVTYLDEQSVPAPDAPNIKLAVEGPTGPIRDLEEGRAKPRVLPIDVTKLVDVDSAGNEPIDYTFQVAAVMEEKLMLEGRQGYLTIAETEPAELTLRIFKLQRAELDIKVYGAAPSNVTLPAKILQPKSGKLAAYVVAGTTPPQARVALTADQLNRAQNEPIMVTANVLPPSKLIDDQVTLTIAPTGLTVVEGEIIRPSLGIHIPISMQGRYRVEVEEESWMSDYAPIKFKAFPGKDREFINQGWHLTLHVGESDKTEASPSHSLRYDAPKGVEILNPVKEPVRFKLVPLEPPANSPS